MDLNKRGLSDFHTTRTSHHKDGRVITAVHHSFHTEYFSHEAAMVAVAAVATVAAVAAAAAVAAVAAMS